MRPSVPTRRRHLRVRPYIDHPLTCYWRCPIEGCHFAAVNSVEHPCPLVPPPDYEKLPASEARPSDALLGRVLSGLQGLPDTPHEEKPTPGHQEQVTPLVRLIDAQKAPTDEIPVVTAEVIAS